jgi:hypothetical protein
LNWAWNEVAIMERLFPALPGFMEYRQTLAAITRESNDVLFDVVEELLARAESGRARTWTNAQLNEYQRRFTERLLLERNGFVERHRTTLLRVLHPERSVEASVA